MKEVSIIGVDLAKQVFQLHGATSEGEAVFRKKLSRKQFLAFMQTHPGCIVAMGDLARTSGGVDCSANRGGNGKILEQTGAD